jgi:hypothetical protein
MDETQRGAAATAENPAALRARAAHVRSVARTLAGDEAEERLLRFAEELVAKATSLTNRCGEAR